MPRPLKVLMVEDNPDDAELLVRLLRLAGFDPDWRRVDTEPTYLAQLDDSLDLVLSDYALPEFNGPRAVELLKQRGLEVPIIIVSGTIGEETAAEAIKLGAADFLLKDRLARLGSAVTNVLTENRLRRESRRALAALRTSEERFRRYFELGMFGMAISSATRGCLEVNDELCRMLGYRREELLQKSWKEITHPDDLGLDRTHFDRVAAGEIDGYTLEKRLVRADGRAIDTMIAVKCVRRADGTVDYFVSLLQDITERKRSELALIESEARFRELAETIQEVFWVTNPEKNRMLYISPAYEKIWGRSCQSLYDSPRTWIEAIHPEDRERVLAAAIAKQMNGTYDEEYRIRRPDGTERWIRDRAFPVRADDGALKRVVGAAQDVTEGKILHEQFLRAQRMEAIGTLAGGIAHDLNNILAPVIMAPTLLRGYARSEHEEHLLDMIEQAAQRGANIVRQLLTFSRGTSGERVTVQLRHLLKELTELMRETFPRNLTIEHRAPRDLRPVLGDPTQLDQVLMNLCVNARDAMPHGGKLSLTAANVQVDEALAQAHPHAKAGPHVALSVADTGHGIPPEIVGRIYDPFFTTKALTKGTGLGLSTVLGIVRSHQGFITVASAPQLGTTFTVYLPVAPEATDAAKAADSAPLPRGQGELILVVDDEEPIRTAIRLILERHGFGVLVASDGAEALAIFLQDPAAVTIVLTDVMMPVLGGLILIRALRSAYPDLKMIAMSGLNDRASGDDLNAAGVTAILAKPCRPRDLLEMIRAHLPAASSS